MKFLNRLFAIASFMLASSVASATVWHPTNIDVDFIQFNASPLYTTNGGDLALFDDSDFGGTALTIGSQGGQVVFTDIGGGDWDAEVFDVNNVSGGSITLSGSKNFTLGMSWDGGTTYYGDTNAVLIIEDPDGYRIKFDGNLVTGAPVTGRTLAIDVSPVPVPAAAWLFGSGLLGLVGVARRRSVL